MLKRGFAVVALAVTFGFSGQSLGPHGTVQGHVLECAGNPTSDIVDVWQNSGRDQTAIAWQRVSDFGTYQFNLSPGDYFVGSDLDHLTPVRVDAASVSTVDLGC